MIQNMCSGNREICTVPVILELEVSVTRCRYWAPSVLNVAVTTPTPFGERQVGGQNALGSLLKSGRFPCNF